MLTDPSARVLATIIACLGGYFFSGAEAKAQAFSSGHAAVFSFHADQYVERTQLGPPHLRGAHPDFSQWIPWALPAPETVISIPLLNHLVGTVRAFRVLTAKEFSFRTGLSPPRAES